MPVLLTQARHPLMGHPWRSWSVKSSMIWRVRSRRKAFCCADAQYSVLKVGPMTISDIPLSAIDFHVSPIVEELCNNAAIAAKAQAHHL